MLKESVPSFLLFLVLQCFPESLAEAMFVFSVVGLRLEPGRLLLVAVFQTLSNLVLLLPISFGVHTVFLIITLTFYVRVATGARLSRVLMAVVGCFIIVGFSELLYIAPLLHLTGIKYVTVAMSPALSALFTLPYDALLAALALLIGRRRGNSGDSAA